MIEDGSRFPPETPEERAQPIISRALELDIIARGYLSSRMDHCKLDWEGLSYLPLPTALRARGWHRQRIVYVAMLHGVSQGTTDKMIEKRGPCTAGEIADLKQRAATLVLAAE